MIRRFAFAAALLAAFAGGTFEVRAQQPDLRTLMDRMDRLQRDMDVMQRNLARGTTGAPAPSAAPAAPIAGGAPSSGFVEQTEVRLSQLEGQMRELTGKLEESLFRSTQLQQRLDKLIGDVDFRLGQLERGGAPAASAPPAPAAEPPTAAAVQAPPRAGANVAPGEQRLVLVPGQPATGPQPAQQAQAGGAPAAAAGQVALPAGTPEVQYEFAYGLYQQAVQDRGDFGRAETALRQFIAANGQHRLAGDAQYWLGETFYARRDWNAASREFAAQFRAYPQNAKAPDSLLRLGQSLGQLNRRTDACGTLSELDRRYPNASQSIKIAATRERQRLQCPG
ncbi:MAG: tol-pal system protein YbgF [Tagaea sp.]|nr:tol-pal system protein YbgF [Tagaea sp.]